MRWGKKVGREERGVSREGKGGGTIPLHSPHTLSRTHLHGLLATAGHLLEQLLFVGGRHLGVAHPRRGAPTLQFSGRSV